MVDTRTLARLVRHTTRARAKLVLVGDHRQLPEIGAGGAFSGLVHRLQTFESSHHPRSYPYEHVAAAPDGPRVQSP